MVDTIYSAMEFYGQGDPYFGGTAADWALYKTEDGGHAFISAADAQRRKLVMAYFPTEAEAEKAGAAASTRKGSISAVPIKPRLEVPTAQISWIVGNKHVGEEDGELAEDFADRAKRAGAADADLIAQIVAYALACHRANQALVAHFGFRKSANAIMTTTGDRPRYSRRGPERRSRGAVT